jgi:uncharacterized protein YlxP (DUF503 family)
MIVGLLQVRLHFPDPQSLKEKRRILKSTVARLRQNHNIAVSEIDDMDLWQSTHLAAVCVGREKKEVDRVLDRVIYFLDHGRQWRMTDHQKELL